MPLDRPDRETQDSSQGLHLRPAQARLVVGVVGEGAVCGDHLRGDPGLHEVAHLGYARKLGLRWHSRLLFVVRRCALADPVIESAKAAVTPAKEILPAAFSMLFFTVSTLYMVLKLRANGRVA